MPDAHSRPVAWRQVLDEIAYLLGEPLPGSPYREPADAGTVAAQLQIPLDAVLRCLAGEEPAPAWAERVVAAWCRLGGKPAAFVPRATPASAVGEQIGER